MLSNFKHKKTLSNEEKYDRNYIKHLPEEITKLSFKKCSKRFIGFDDEFYYKNKKLNNAINRFFIKCIGKNYSYIYKKFFKIKYFSEKELQKEFFTYYDYLIFDENNILVEYNNPIKNYHKQHKYIQFTIAQLKHNDEEVKKIPNFYKFKNEPYGYINPSMRGMKKLGKFYIPYKNEVVLVDLFLHPIYFEYYKIDEINKKEILIKPIRVIYGYKQNVYLEISHYFWDYYTKRIGINEENNKIIYSKKIGNLGFGNLLEQSFFFINQAEKELERLKLK